MVSKPASVPGQTSTAELSDSKSTPQPSDDIKPAPSASSPTPSEPTSGPNESDEKPHICNPADPLDFGRHRRHDTSLAKLKSDHPNAKPKKVKKFYTRQNKLIDQFLGADDEEQLAVEEDVRMGPKIRFAVNASFLANFCLFVIQMYAAISTGSLSVRNLHA